MPAKTISTKRGRIEDVQGFDEILITGTITSETPNVRVRRLPAMISTISRGWIKVWPLDSNDPQLPADHNGKLWFCTYKSTIIVTERDLEMRPPLSG
jgi:hypothetical protein